MGMGVGGGVVVGWGRAEVHAFLIRGPRGYYKALCSKH